jgi:uncharacterized membrane protein
MNKNSHGNRLIQPISALLLIITFLVQIVAVILIDADIGYFEMEEFHPVSGFAFFGAILIYLLIVRKSLMRILISKTQ